MFKYTPSAGKYRFYGPLQANAVVTCQQVDALRARLPSPKGGFALEEVVSLSNKAALDQYRAGQWERALKICQCLLGLLEAPHITGADREECRASCLLNIARLWSARGEYVQAMRYFDLLISIEGARWDILLPEIANGFLTAGAYTAGLACLEELEARRLPQNIPHLLLAKSRLLLAMQDYHAVSNLHALINGAELKPVEQCWFSLDRATTSLALGDTTSAESTHKNVANSIDQLWLQSQGLSPMSLLISLALAESQAKIGDSKSAITRVRKVITAAAVSGFEAIVLRSGALLFSLLRSSGIRLADSDLQELTTTAQKSRYWVEVMGVWLHVGKYLVDVGTHVNDQSTGATYLSRVALECTSDKPPALHALMQEATTLLDHLQRKPIGHHWRFVDDEPVVLSRAFIAVTELIQELSASRYAKI